MTDLCYDCRENEAITTCPHCNQRICMYCTLICGNIKICNTIACYDKHEVATHCKYCDEHKCEIELCDKCLQEHCSYKDDCNCKHTQLTQSNTTASMVLIDGNQWSIDQSVDCDFCDAEGSLIGQVTLDI